MLYAERGWAYGMELKQNGASQTKEKFQMRRRFAKAAKWATIFEDLCQKAGDRVCKRTSLEATAYSAWMHGNNHMER